MYVNCFINITLIFGYFAVGLCSSLSSGVVSKVVQIPPAQHSHLPSNVQTDSMDLPVMLQTTAAVHPGASGGVIVNSHGRMVGLITRYAQTLLRNSISGHHVATVKLHAICISITNSFGGFVLFRN